MRSALMIVIALSAALFAIVPTMSIPRIEQDLTLRAAETLKDGGHEWAAVSAEGLAIKLSGEAPSQAARQDALALVSGLEGVRAVADVITLTPPRVYGLQFVRDAEQGVSLNGEAPDQDAVDALIGAIESAAPGLAIDSAVSIAPGEPLAGWRAAAAAAAAQAVHLFAGTVELSAEGIRVSGSVLDQGSLDAIESMDAGEAFPSLIDVTVQATRLYPLALTRSADLLTISGEAPDGESRDALIALAERQNVPLVDAEHLIVVPGVADDSWQSIAGALIRHVSSMEEAEARLEPGRLMLSGFMADGSMAELVRTGLRNAFGGDSGTQLIIDIETPDTPIADLPVLSDTQALLAFADSAPIEPLGADEMLGVNDCQTALNGLLAREQIGFVDDTADLDPASQALLEAVAVTLRRCQGAMIEVSGHLDSMTDPEASQALSTARAEAVVDYLVRRGVDGSALVAAGYGDLLPIADNATEAGRARNQRIEFIVEQGR